MHEYFGVRLKSLNNSNFGGGLRNTHGLLATVRLSCYSYNDGLELCDLTVALAGTKQFSQIVIFANLCWRQIRMSCFLLINALRSAVVDIQPVQCTSV